MAHRNGIKSTSKTPWWLWPNLLSLDAPAVALVWHLAFARAFGLPLEWPTMGLLVLAVGLVYAVDRLLDVRGLRNLEKATARHRFYWVHQQMGWRLVLVGTSIAIAIAMTWASRSLLGFGLLMGMLAGTYLLWVHRHWRWLRKELACGLVFSAGTTLSLLTGGALEWPSGWFWVAVLAFAALCAANCFTIAAVEVCEDALHDPMAATQQSPWWVAQLSVGLWLGGVIMVGLWWWSSVWIFGAMACGFLGLQAVARSSQSSRHWRRVAADGCLFAPMLWLVLP